MFQAFHARHQSELDFLHQGNQGLMAHFQQLLYLLFLLSQEHEVGFHPNDVGYLLTICHALVSNNQSKLDGKQHGLQHFLECSSEV